MKKFEKARQQLLELINRSWQEKKFRLPPERKLAEMLQLSRSTIVKSLGELETSGIIVRKVGSGTYICPEFMSTVNAKVIALVMRNVVYPSDRHFSFITETMAKCAKEHGVVLRIFDGVSELFSREPDDNCLLRAIGNHEVEGVLIASRLPLTIIGKLVNETHCVSINNIFGDGSDIPCISCNYFQVGFLAGQHLIAAGHRKIAYITDSFRHPESRVELSGLQAALASAEVELTAEDILEFSRNSIADEARTKEFFARKKYSACFIRNAVLLHGLLPVLPEDMEIVGNGKYASPARGGKRLTLIDNRLDEMCKLGMQTLLGLISGKKTVDTGLILLTPQMLKEQNHG